MMIFVDSSDADVLAATTSDGRMLTTGKVANDTATNLNWTLNGLLDSGDMTAINAAGNGQVLFNSTSTTLDLFAPLLNTENGNTFWTATVALTVAPGSAVTLTDVGFVCWAINGSGVQNVDR